MALVDDNAIEALPLHERSGIADEIWRGRRLDTDQHERSLPSLPGCPFEMVHAEIHDTSQQVSS